MTERTNARVLRWLVGDIDFSIVSNNCWGAHVYQALDVAYRTPFVGLFIPPKSYLYLLEHFDACMRAELTFVNRSEHARLNVWRERERLNYPIGLLHDDVEVHFLHYRDEADALSKWERRRARLVNDPKRLFIKFDDREGATDADVAAFFRLPFVHKLCFAGRPGKLPVIVAPAEGDAGHVIDGVSLGRISYRYFNTLRWLSAWPPWLPLPSLL